MPLTDNFILPRRVRTMEQMADLLQAEEAELAQAQRVIDAMINQLAVGTSTFLLPRHERIFGLPVNTEESMEVRRARVLARLNVRGVTTVQTILEMVRIIAEREGKVTEHFADYSFSVTVHMLVSDGTAGLRELIRQLDEVKPAHLLFDMTGAVQPVALENRNRLLFVGQSIRLRVNNLVEVIYLDGRRNLDGSWALSQRAIKGAAFYRLLFSLGAANRYGQALSWAVRASVHATEAVNLAGMQVCRYSANNLGMGETRGKGVSLSRFTMACRAENRQRLACSVTSQVDRKLDGTFLLDGTKNLNSGITRSEL